jgi:hypothetical protein
MQDMQQQTFPLSLSLLDTQTAVLYIPRFLFFLWNQKIGLVKIVLSSRSKDDKGMVKEKLEE